MVIQLPKDIEERLNELADREGTPAQRLAVDAIRQMLERRGTSSRWPLPEIVGITDERQPDTDWARRRPIEGIIGMYPNGGANVEDFDEWLEAQRASDERLARKTSLGG